MAIVDKYDADNRKAFLTPSHPTPLPPTFSPATNHAIGHCNFQSDQAAGGLSVGHTHIR